MTQDRPTDLSQTGRRRTQGERKRRSATLQTRMRGTWRPRLRRSMAISTGSPPGRFAVSGSPGSPRKSALARHTSVRMGMIAGRPSALAFAPALVDLHKPARSSGDTQTGDTRGGQKPRDCRGLENAEYFREAVEFDGWGCCDFRRSGPDVLGGDRFETEQKVTGSCLFILML